MALISVNQLDKQTEGYCRQLANVRRAFSMLKAANASLDGGIPLLSRELRLGSTGGCTCPCSFGRLLIG